jgi:hypothetical protein
VSKMPDDLIHLAIHEANKRHVEIRVEQDANSFTTHIHANTGTDKLSVSFSSFELMTHENPEEVITAAIKDMTIKLTSQPKSRIADLEAELRTYKDAVKQLSFDLEMSQTKSTAIKVDEIRKVTLAQASRYVMDFGVPKSGAELERLCKEIEGLKTTKDAAMEAASKKMQEAFGNE